MTPEEEAAEALARRQRFDEAAASAAAHAAQLAADLKRMLQIHKDAKEGNV